MEKIVLYLKGMNKMKIDFVMIVFNADPFIKLNLENLYPFANRIIIIEGPVLHYQKLGFKSSTDNTIKNIKEFPDPENKIFLESACWNSKNEMVKAQEKYFNGDFVWAIDADEFYKKEDTEKVIKYLKENSNCYSMAFRLRSFFGGFERYISGFEENFEVIRIQRITKGSYWKTHRPPTMWFMPENKTCKEIGHIDHYTTDNWGIRIYHYSHVFPSQVKAKMAYYYSRDPNGIIKKYWDNLYVPWMKAKTEQEKLNIEILPQFQGVQENTPQIRGEAYTKQFDNEHPEIIKKYMFELKEIYNKEIIQYGLL